MSEERATPKSNTVYAPDTCTQRVPVSVLPTSLSLCLFYSYERRRRQHISGSRARKQQEHDRYSSTYTEIRIWPAPPAHLIDLALRKPRGEQVWHLVTRTGVVRWHDTDDLLDRLVHRRWDPNILERPVWCVVDRWLRGWQSGQQSGRLMVDAWVGVVFCAASLFGARWVGVSRRVGCVWPCYLWLCGACSRDSSDACLPHWNARNACPVRSITACQDDVGNIAHPAWPAWATRARVGQ
jgi:hypothetical protein